MLDWSFIIENTPMYIKAAIFTLKIASIGIIYSVLIGLIASVILYFKIPVLRQLITGYVELSRNTPLLIQLFFLYFGLPKLGIMISSELCGIIGLSFLGGGYMTEAFRSGLESVGKNLVESGLSIGLSNMQVAKYIIIPKAISVSIPPLCANIIFLIKETSVFGVVALEDLLFVAKDLIGLYYKTDEALFMLVVSYLIILLPLTTILHFVERRVRYAEYGN